jgi:hypothetical protein
VTSVILNRLSGIYFGTPVLFAHCFRGLQEDRPMKSILTIMAAGLLAGSFAMSADAATKKSGMTQVKAQCEAQAKKKFSAIHFLKRRDYVKNCMHQKA